MQLSASYTLLYIPLRFMAYYRPIFRQKTIVLLQLYLVSWALLVFNTVLVSIFKISGFYFLTFLNASILLSLLLGLAEHFELPPSVKKQLVKHVRRGSNGEQQEEEVIEEATERTPLLDREEAEVRELQVDEENQYLLWTFQLLFAAPFVMILLVQFMLLILGALRQTLADGSSSNTSQYYCLTNSFTYRLNPYSILWNCSSIFPYDIAIGPVRPQATSELDVAFRTGARHFSFVQHFRLSVLK